VKHIGRRARQSVEERYYKCSEYESMESTQTLQRKRRELSEAGQLCGESGGVMAMGGRREHRTRLYPLNVASARTSRKSAVLLRQPQ